MAEHRARSPERRTPHAPGRRKAIRHGREHSRRGMLRGRRCVPTLVGVAALVLAGSGTVAMGQGTDLGGLDLSSRTSLLAGAPAAASGREDSASASELADRQRAASRDSRRQALRDASQAKREQAAKAQARQRGNALATLAASAQKHADEIAARAWQLPVTPGAYHLTARFGEASSLWASTHTGLDFAAPTGTPIRAVAGGVVGSTGYDGAYGNKTVVTLDDGTEIWYCHQTAFAASPGQRVDPGDVVGYIGSTGNTTGPHLHLEVHPGGGGPVDPMGALQAHGLQP